MHKKRDKVRIKRIVLDLHDVIADSKKVVVFEYEMSLLSYVGNPSRQGLKYGNSLLYQTQSATMFRILKVFENVQGPVSD